MRRTLLPLLILLAAQTAYATTAAEYRRMADASVKAAQYAKAAEYYRQEAVIYRKIGDPNAAKVEEMKAERWSTEIELFVDDEPDRSALERNYTGAKHEPLYGCYLGAYLPYDDRVKEASGSRLLEEGFEKLIGRRVSTSYLYCRYGQEFPLRWAKALCERGIAPHVAWEPNHGLNAVRNDDYLRRFAKDAGSCGGPVFLRFAGEMNGGWTRWGRQPALYKAKFKLVHDVMQKYAPNIAMVWCVNYIPEHNIADYYPGDAYVDWVGVNCYSVIYHDNNRNRPALYESPSSFIKYVYEKYSAKKPIAICEWGASHEAALEHGRQRPEFAVEKIAQMFSALPRLFPRVKLIDVFDCNNIKNAVPSRQLNNYCLTDNAEVLAAFKQAVSTDYYLSEAVTEPQEDVPTYLTRVTNGSTLDGKARLSAWVKSYEGDPTVVYTIDGRQIGKVKSPGECRAVFDASDFPEGAHKLAVDVIDSNGRSAGRKEVSVTFQ